MLKTQLRDQGLPVALVAALAAAAYTSADLARAPIAAPVSLLCALVGPSALAVMAPCLLQLALVLAAASAGVAATAEGRPWRAGLAFAGGFLGVYAVGGLAVGLAGQALLPWAHLLQAAGGVLLALLGLAVLRLLPGRALSGCRGPRWLILTGRANLRRPAGAGAAFAIYCLGCCGPYLAGLALLGAGAGSAAAGAALVAAFALMMGALLLLPILSPGAARSAQTILRRHGQAVALAAGAALVALGVAIALEPALVFALSH